MANTAMRTDVEQARGAGVDVSPFVGTWYGIKLDENRIAKLVITEEDGALLIHPYGSADSELFDWGQATAIPYIASGAKTNGFRARCRVGAMQVDFFTIENQGVLLVQTFTSFHDDSGRAGEFGKAYYRRSAEELVANTGISTGDLTGEWVNSYPATKWVAGFTLTEDSGVLTMRIRGASDPIDWGEAEVTVCRDKHGEANLFAVYDLEPFEASVGVISVKNVVVLNVFLRFKDGESTNSFSRDFFFRNPSG